MAEKKSFMMSYDHQALFQQLTDEQAGKLIKAIYAYEIESIYPTFDDPLLNAFFAGVFKNFLDAHKAQYEKKCRQNAENVAKRWNKSKHVECSVNETIQNDTNVYERIRKIQTNTKHTDNDNDNDISKVGIVNIEDARAREGNDLPSCLPITKHLDVISFYQENIDPLMSSYVATCISDDCELYGEENVLLAIKQAKLANKRNYNYIRATAKGKHVDAVYGPSEAYQTRQKETAPPKTFSEENCLSGLSDILASKGYELNGG